MRSINLRAGAVMVAFALLPAGALSQTAPTAAPTVPAPATTAPVATAAPTAIAPMPTEPLGSDTPSATFAPTPSAAPTIAPSHFHYSYNPPMPTVDAPRIIEIDLTDKVVRSGPIELRVLADESVASVQVRAMGRTIAVPRLGAGLFAAESTVPDIPFFVRGRTVWVDFVATRGDGRSTVVSLPVTLG